VNRKCCVLVLSLVLDLHKVSSLLFEDPGYYRHGKNSGKILILMGFMGGNFFCRYQLDIDRCFACCYKRTSF
jgi:hypothetical protein